MQFDSFEQEYVLSALLSYAEMGNPIIEDIYKILIEKLEMSPSETFVYLNRPPITLWIHNSIFIPGQGMKIDTPEAVAIVLNQAFEGEYYCTLNPIDREPLKKHTEAALWALESPTFPLAKAIQERHQELKETQDIQKSEFSIFFRVKKLFALSEKIKGTSYPEDLKIFVLLELYYKIYSLVKKGSQFENKIIAEKMFNKLIAGVNDFLIAEEYSSAFHEIMMVLSSSAFHDRFVYTQDPSFQEKSFCWFTILRTKIDLKGLFKRPWMQDLRIILFKHYYAHICGKKEMPCSDRSIAHAVNHLLQIETDSAGIFVWLENAQLLPYTVPIFFDNRPLKKDPKTQNALESETARALYMNKLHLYIRAKYPIDAGIQKILLDFFKMLCVKIIWEEESLEVPIWISAAIIKNNTLCIDSEDRVAKILIPSYAGETYFSSEVLQDQISSDIDQSAMVLQCHNYVLSKIMKDYEGKNFLEENMSVENGLKLSLGLCKTRLHIKQIEFKRKQQLEKTKQTSMSDEQVINYLLMFCEHIIEKIEITQGVIIFLLEINYEIHAYFEKLTKGDANLQTLKHRYLLGLKELLSVSEEYSTHQEPVYMLLCRILQTEKHYKFVNKENQFETVEKLFSAAMLHYSKHIYSLEFPWANTVRKTVLKQMLIKSDVEYSMRDIASHFQALGNKECHEWITAKENAILPIDQRSKVESAIHYYTVILWMADVQLFVETPKKGDIKEYAKIKRARLKEDLEKSKKEETILLLAPGLAYIQAGNIPTEAMKGFLNDNPGVINEVELLLQKRYKTSIKTILKEEEIKFLIEMYEGLKVKPYDPFFKSVFQLDVLWQVYNRFSRVIVPVFDSHTSLFELSVQVEDFIVDQENTIFFEIANVLLFSIRRYSVKQNSLQIYTSEGIAFCFTNAINSKNTVFFKAPWADRLRKEALLLYMTEFSSFPASKTCNSLKKIIGYLTSSEMVNEHSAILEWMLNTNMVTEKQIEENRQKPKNRKIHSIEDAVLGLNDIVKDLKNSPVKSLAQEMQRAILSTSKKETKTKRKPKKQKEKIKEAPPQDMKMSEIDLEAQARLREQELKNKIQREQEAAAYQKAIALKNQENQKEQEDLERQQAADAWRVKREEKAKLHALKVENNSERNTQKIREGLRLKNEKKEENNKRIKVKQEAELKAKQEQKNKLETIKLEEKRLKDERKRAELKVAQEKENLKTLQQYNLAMQQEKEKSIALRPLHNFDIEELTELELPIKNQKLLKDLIKITNAHHISEIELYGSYTVFLASLRLDFPINKVRRPSDLDLRIVIESKDLNEQLNFIRDLQNRGYILKGYSEHVNKTKGLVGYILEKKLGGFLNLSLAVDKGDKETYEMELTIIFKQNYIANHNPFYLLSHCIKISNNECAFDGSDLQARAQLAHDIMNRNFNIILDELFDPVNYNVFNFFPRLFRNIETWKAYYETNTKDIHDLLNNLEAIIKFFSIRFSLSKYRECYLELVGLITQNQFALAQSALVIKGFLIALFEVINREALSTIKRKAFFLDIKSDVHEITQKLQEKFTTLICVVHGDQDINKTIFKRFYKALIEVLVEQGRDETVKFFLRQSQEIKRSVLYNPFQKGVLTLDQRSSAKKLTCR